jgi:hypothetical protein
LLLVKRPPAAFRFLVALVGLAACSSGPEVTAVDPTTSSEVAAPTTTTTSTSIDQEFPGGEIALGYFDDIAASSASDHAEPGSPAAHYALYLEQVSASDPTQPGTAQADDDQVLVTNQYPDGTSGEVTYSDIQVSPDGVRTFTVEGTPLNERLATATEPVANGPVEVGATISYLAVSGGHFVTVSVTNNADTTFTAFAGSFVDNNGLQTDLIAFLNNAEIRPGATGIVAMELPGVDAATGTLYLDGTIDDFNTPLAFTIPIPPLP